LTWAALPGTGALEGNSAADVLRARHVSRSACPSVSSSARGTKDGAKPECGMTSNVNRGRQWMREPAGTGVNPDVTRGCMGLACAGTSGQRRDRSCYGEVRSESHQLPAASFQQENITRRRLGAGGSYALRLVVTATSFQLPASSKRTSRAGDWELLEAGS
jgi:hypothetical protein